MGRINILQAEVFNKIAAGEVVEKPASIVKEFIENSIDASSTDILIEIEGGGIDKIKVVDNGIGIHPDDVKSAFLPHATSKIKTTEDLSNILTLGFRGEALASIASVSKLKMQTKQEGFETGKVIEIEGGIIKNFADCSVNNGTIVEVNDLFYNIPARRKFLRKPKTEESEITNLITRYILANPTIKFTYIVDGVVIYKTNGISLNDAIYLVYKKEFLDNLLKLDYSCDNIKINGYVSKPSYTKSNRTYQTLIINGRYVINSLISSAIQNAYANQLMKGQFPAYILNLTIPNNSLDVNVHPNKLDVKFENSQKIFGYFYSAVTKALMGFSEVKQINDGIDFTQDKIKILQNLNKVSAGKSFIETQNAELEQKKADIKNAYKNLVSEKNVFNDTPILTQTLNNQLTSLEKSYENVVETNIKANESFNINLESKDNQNITTKQQIFENVNNLDYKIIGTFLNTYILIEMDNSLFVFDQHACHERINYDKLITQLNNKEIVSQPLLLPYVLNTNSLEGEFLENKIEVLKSLGFEIGLFGQNCYKVSSVPQILYSISLKEFFNEIFADLLTLKKLTSADVLKEHICQKACKASVRAGDKLSEKDIEILLNTMKENNMILACPHGRPAVIQITQNELEKWFKRKV